MSPSTCDFDLVVIGGGPGGSTAAAYARQNNLKVLVVEKEQFPRFHIGESMLPMSNAILRETGTWPKLEAAGFVRKYGAAFVTSNGRATTEIAFNESLVPGLDYTFQVDRAKFDSLLLDHAQELGAEVRTQTRVSAVDYSGGVHSVRLEAAPSAEASAKAGSHVVTAQWVIDASGRDNLFRDRQKRVIDPSPFPKRVAIYSHFLGVGRASGLAGGHTVAVRLENGWFWLIPIDEKITSVGLVTTVEAMRNSGLKPEELFARAVAGSAKLRELFSGAQAQPTMPFHVTSDYSYFRRELADERMIRIGDAAGFFDPIFSSGVYMSLWSARMAVGLIMQARAAGRGLTERERLRYGRTVKRHASVFQKLIAVFYDNDSFAVFMCERVPWGIREAICSIVAGHARLSWPLWWRFRIFLFVCWLQRRRIRACPVLDYSEATLDSASPNAAS